MEEYLSFLTDLAGRDLQEARRRAPRRSRGPASLLHVTPGGLELPNVGPDGEAWDARWPVVGISWHDAVAYCEWRSEREGRRLRLPTETEWEKAARGVDGRRFPWGSQFDPELCNVRTSRRANVSLARVDAYAGDVSPYGVQGMAGNTRDWTASVNPDGTGNEAFAVRGGAAAFTWYYALCAHRDWADPTTVDDTLGFRVACSAPMGRG
jgi:serine/threonine-protein kinase